MVLKTIYCKLKTADTCNGDHHYCLNLKAPLGKTFKKLLKKAAVAGKEIALSFNNRQEIFITISEH